MKLNFTTFLVMLSLSSQSFAYNNFTDDVSEAIKVETVGLIAVEAWNQGYLDTLEKNPLHWLQASTRYNESVANRQRALRTFFSNDLIPYSGLRLKAKEKNLPFVIILKGMTASQNTDSQNADTQNYLLKSGRQCELRFSQNDQNTTFGLSRYFSKSDRVNWADLYLIESISFTPHHLHIHLIARHLNPKQLHLTCTTSFPNSDQMTFDEIQQDLDDTIGFRMTPYKIQKIKARQKETLKARSLN